jgi:hypothetical protein
MKYLSLFGINGVAGRQGRSWWKIYACLLIGLLATGCAPTITASYKIDNIEKPSQMSFSEALRAFHSFNKKVNTENGVATGKIVSNGIIVTGNIYFPFADTFQPGEYLYPFGEVKELNVLQYGGHTYLSYDEGGVTDVNFHRGVCFDTPDDAKRFMDTFIALKYYLSSRFLADDAVAFVDFQEKSRAWRALAVKPALPGDVQRFRVAAEDAFKNKKFQEAAEYYEQGLAVEPLWPQGQYNAALLEGELLWYGMAAFHMKRYLELVPDAANAKAALEKMYLWEVKAKETPSLSESMQETPEKEGRKKFKK